MRTRDGVGGWVSPFTGGGGVPQNREFGWGEPFSFAFAVPSFHGVELGLSASWKSS